MKFLFFTDLQLSNKTPVNRVDDYPVALVDKLAQVYGIARDKGCDCVIFGGDFFNSPRIYAFHLILDALKIINVPTYMVIGQHDVSGYNKESYSKSTLGFFEHINRCLRCLWEDTDVGGIIFRPCHVWDDIEAMNSMEMPDKPSVLVAHHLLSDGMDVFDVVDINRFGQKCPYDMVLSGDLHKGYKPKKVGKTWFVNPGSIARQTIADIGRTPAVAFIEFTDDISVEIIDLNCRSDIFSDKVVKKSQKKEYNDFDPKDFISAVESFGEVSVNFLDLLLKVGGKDGIDPAVIAYIDEKWKTMEVI